MHKVHRKMFINLDLYLVIYNLPYILLYNIILCIYVYIDVSVYVCTVTY